MGEKLTAAEARMAQELGNHATNEAFEVIARVIASAPAGISTAIMVVVYAQMQWKIKATIKAYAENVDSEFPQHVAAAEAIIEEGESARFAVWAEKTAKKIGVKPIG